MTDRVLRKKLKEKYGDEQVYVVLREKTEHIKDGASFMEEENLLKAEKLLRGKFVFRMDAEYEPALQQIIPYVLVMSPDRKKFFVTERTAGEERLKGSLALGAGGHINPVDMTGDASLFENAAQRELFEELSLKTFGELKEKGFVRDLKGTTADHLGIIYLITAKEAEVKEKDRLRGFWMTKEELIDHYERFESWARLIIDEIYSKSKQPPF